MESQNPGARSQDLHIDVRLKPVIASDILSAAATGFASLMKRNDLFFWLSIAWLAVLCMAFVWIFLQMTLPSGAVSHP